MNLTTPYQVTKMLGELYCNFFHNHYGLKVVKTRFFNNYGAGEVPGQYRNVVPNFIYYAMKACLSPLQAAVRRREILPTLATQLTVCCGWV